MKVKFRENMYIPTSTKLFTCKGCVFLSDNGTMCEAPDCIYTSCCKVNQLFHNSQKFSKIFEL